MQQRERFLWGGYVCMTSFITRAARVVCPGKSGGASRRTVSLPWDDLRAADAAELHVASVKVGRIYGHPFFAPLDLFEQGDGDEARHHADDQDGCGHDEEQQRLARRAAFVFVGLVPAAASCCVAVVLFAGFAGTTTLLLQAAFAPLTLVAGRFEGPSARTPRRTPASACSR